MSACSRQPARSPCFLWAGEQPGWGGASMERARFPGLPSRQRLRLPVDFPGGRRAPLPQGCLEAVSTRTQPPAFSKPAGTPLLAPSPSPRLPPLWPLPENGHSGGEQQRNLGPAPRAASQTGDVTVLLQGYCWLPGGAVLLSQLKPRCRLQMSFYPPSTTHTLLPRTGQSKKKKGIC